MFSWQHTKIKDYAEPTFLGMKLKYSESVKYLGVILDQGSKNLQYISPIGPTRI